jgi:DNA-binding response OmpR family regulator
MSKVLIADDDVNIAYLIADSLHDENIETVIVHDGCDVLPAIKSCPDFDVIILDIMMPKMNGLEACKQIREKIKCPILFLTAKKRTIDTILGLEIGADDYITKPFIVEELVAKVKAHIRRDKRILAADGNVITIGKLTIFRDRFEVRFQDENINLTTREFQLLIYMCDHIGKVLTREQIFDAVWGMDYSDIGSVTVTIKNLRNKIDPHNHIIKTVWGVGYKLVRPEVIS